MNCKKTNLLLYVDGELPDQEKLAVESHLNVCSECRAEAKNLRETATTIGQSFSSPPLPPEFIDTLMSGIARQPRPTSAPQRVSLLSRRGILFTAAAALLVAASAAVLPLLNRDSSSHALFAEAPSGMLIRSGDGIRYTAGPRDLSPGTTVVTLPQTHTRLDLEGATAEIGPLSSVRLPREDERLARIQLESGQVLLSVTESGTGFDVSAGDWDLSLSKGLFELEVDACASTTLIVHAYQGNVIVRGEEGLISTVQEGQQATGLSSATASGRIITTPHSSPAPTFKTSSPQSSELTRRLSDSKRGMIVELESLTSGQEEQDLRAEALQTLTLIAPATAEHLARTILSEKPPVRAELFSASVRALDARGNAQDASVLKDLSNDERLTIDRRLIAGSAHFAIDPVSATEGAPPLPNEPASNHRMSGKRTPLPAPGPLSAKRIVALLGPAAPTAWLNHATLGNDEEDDEDSDTHGATSNFDGFLRSNEVAFNILAANAASVVQDSRTTFFLQRLLRSTEPTLWIAALTALRRLENPDLAPDIEAVIRATKDIASPRLRSKVEASLAGNAVSNSPELIPALLDLYRSESNRDNKLWILSALESIDAEEVADFLHDEVLGTESSSLIQAKVVEILATRQDPRVVESVRSGLSSPSPRLQEQALRWASNLKSPALHGAICTILTNPGASTTIRNAAAMTLGAMADPRSADDFLSLRFRTERRFAGSIGYGIGATITADQLDDAVNVLASPETSPWMSAGILSALLPRVEIFGDTSSLAATLPQAMDSPNLRLRKRAAMMAGRLGDPALSPNLHPLLTDSSVDVRRAAAEAIHALGDESGVNTLLAELEDRAHVRLALRGLETILDTFDETTKEKVALRVSEKLAFLNQLPGDGRISALRILVKLEKPVDIAHLRPILIREPTGLGERHLERLAAALILVQQGNPDGDDILRSLLIDPKVVEDLLFRLSPFVRQEINRADLIRDLHHVRMQLERNVFVSGTILAEIVRRALIGQTLGQALPRYRDVPNPAYSQLYENDAEARELEIREIDRILARRNSIVTRLQSVAIGTGDSQSQRLALVRLGWISSPRAVSALLLAVQDSNPEVARTAERILSQLGLSANLTQVELREQVGADPATILRQYRNLMASTLDDH